MSEVKEVDIEFGYLVRQGRAVPVSFAGKMCPCNLCKNQRFK